MPYKQKARRYGDALYSELVKTTKKSRFPAMQPLAVLHCVFASYANETRAQPSCTATRA